MQGRALHREGEYPVATHRQSRPQARCAGPPIPGGRDLRLWTSGQRRRTSMQRLTTSQGTQPTRPLRVAGFPVRVGWSAIAVGALLAWSLAGPLFPLAFPGYTGGVYWAAGLVTAGLFLASVLAHELGHALLARRS